MTYSKAVSSKGSKNSVGVKDNNGTLCLRLPRSVSKEFFGKDQHLIALGLPNIEKNQKLAQRKADWMTDDIHYGCFDPTLEKYEIGKTTHLTVIHSIKPKSEPTLMEIWNMWLEQGELIWEAKTKSKHKAFNNHVQKIPSDLLSLDKATEVRDFLVKNCPTYTAKEILVRINAATKKALEKGLIIRNPYEGLASEITIQPKSEEEIVDPFNAQERDLLISTYENHKHYKKYAPLIKAMFWTGARPSELIGLKWGSVNKNFDLIVFKEAIVYDAGKKIEKQSTKTKKIRRFPVSQHKLKNLLMELKPENAQPDDLVFHRGDGQPIDYGQFYRSWHGGNNGAKKYHGVVVDLVEKNLLSHYRSPYQTRHTFATLCIENDVPLHDVARLLGNSAKVCSEIYIKSRRDLRLPEF